jgi:hypothetical protein
MGADCRSVELSLLKRLITEDLKNVSSEIENPARRETHTSLLLPEPAVYYIKSVLPYLAANQGKTHGFHATTIWTRH